MVHISTVTLAVDFEEERRSSKRALVPVQLLKVSESHLADLGPLIRQSDQMMEMLKHRSFYGGHLNVLYVVQAESLLLMELAKLYPKPGVIDRDSTNDLGLPVHARSELAQFVESLPLHW